MAKAVTLKNASGEYVYPVTSMDVIFGSINFCNFTHERLSTTITSTSYADKMHIFLPEPGHYMIMSCLNTYNGDGGFNGEVNTKLMCGSRYDILTTFLPPLSWAGSANSQIILAIADTANTEVKLQASVNWPSRGTCYIGDSYLAYVRIGNIS